MCVMSWLFAIPTADAFNLMGDPKARQTHHHADVDDEEGGGANIEDEDHCAVGIGC